MLRRDVGQPRGEAARPVRPAARRGQLGQPGQPGEPGQARVPGHAGEPHQVAHAVLDPHDVRALLAEPADVPAGDLRVPDVQHHAHVRHGLGDGRVVVNPAVGRQVRADRLVNHDHAGPGRAGVGRGADRGGDVVADAGQHLRAPADGADRGLGGGPGLLARQRVELPGVAVGGDQGDPVVDQAADEPRVAVPVGGAVRAERGDRDRGHGREDVEELVGDGRVNAHRYSIRWRAPGLGTRGR